jgi:hypothetical protein
VRRAFGALSLAALLLPVALVACSSKGPNDRSDWEIKNEEKLTREEGAILPELPPYPEDARLIPFFVTSASEFRFYIDGGSLSVGKDRIIRYVLVARSRSGANNVSFEGLNCQTNEYIVYAIGTQGKWVTRTNQWRSIEVRSVDRWHNALRSEYFCPNAVAIFDTEEGLDALRRGGHPRVQTSPSSR